MTTRMLPLALTLLALIACGGDKSDSDTGASDTGPTGETGAPAAVVFAPDDLVDGQTLSQLNARWWEWLVSIPAATAPANGGDCTQNQDDNVFFLAGTNGDGPANRDCTVPAGVPIFIPTFTSIVFSCPEAFNEDACDLSTEDELLAEALGYFEEDRPRLSFSLTLDGEPIEGLEDYFLEPELLGLDYTLAAPSIFFKEKDRYGEGIPAADVECAAPIDEDNVCGLEEGPKPAATYGNGVAFVPFAAGETHELHMTSALGDPAAPDFAIDVTYDLTVQ